jgi:hypothetical protein
VKPSEETNIFGVWNIDQLKAEIKVSDIAYNMKQMKAILTYNMIISFGNQTASALFRDCVVATPESINGVNDRLHLYETRIKEAMSVIKAPIKMLLQLSDNYVSVDLHDILEQLIKKIDMKGKRVK